jgi:hypothetical protein
MQLIQAYQTWRRRRATSRELDELGPDGRAAIARDIGVAEETLALAAAGRTSPPSELPRLMRLLALEPEIVERRHSSVMRDMRVVCACCAEASRCRKSLDRGRARSDFRRYCPNAETLDAIGEDTLSRTSAA